eukprot:CAMPEP_0172692002 /NCGR_PEP_ID=MMETSP1074-20121228/24930_1 /TAXON_ID=2916 /ORGANISM="Ceratium fusus, Strain PA161109" /LENGTH=174 /DNA_ID=CAMNT_0013512121 /DNA_START=78 /DNA_END=602 /DNA_ORIENTATION=+
MATPVVNLGGSQDSGDAAQQGGVADGLRSKGILPALGVGGAVYLITGAVSLGTLAIVGVGAGVGYGVGTWIRDQYDKKEDGASDQATFTPTEQLPQEFQVSLCQWQVFLGSRAAGSSLTPPQLQALFAEFEKLEPEHAGRVRMVQHAVDGHMGATAETALGPSPIKVVQNVAEV